MCYNKRKHRNHNSRQKRKNKFRTEKISEAQRLSIVNTVLSKKRLLIYSDNL